MLITLYGPFYFPLIVWAENGERLKQFGTVFVPGPVSGVGQTLRTLLSREKAK